jgi:hypothetical protein
MEAAGTSETSVNFCPTTRRYNPEDSHLSTVCVFCSFSRTGLHIEVRQIFRKKTWSPFFYLSSVSWYCCPCSVICLVMLAAYRLIFGSTRNFIIMTKPKGGLWRKTMQYVVSAFSRNVVLNLPGLHRHDSIIARLRLPTNRRGRNDKNNTKRF